VPAGSRRTIAAAMVAAAPATAGSMGSDMRVSKTEWDGIVVLCGLACAAVRLPPIPAARAARVPEEPGTAAMRRRRMAIQQKRQGTSEALKGSASTPECPHLTSNPGEREGANAEAPVCGLQTCHCRYVTALILSEHPALCGSGQHLAERRTASCHPTRKPRQVGRPQQGFPATERTGATAR
jgi:hypothetical protein